SVFNEEGAYAVMQKRSPYRFILSALALAAVAFGGVSTVVAQEGEGTATPTEVSIEKVALVTPGSRTNQGWDQQGADNITSVAESLGIEVEVAENAGYDDITPILQ